MGCRWVRGRCGAGGGGWRWGKVGVGMGCRWVRGRCVEVGLEVERSLPMDCCPRIYTERHLYQDFHNSDPG